MIIFMNTIKAARSELIEVCEKADIEIGHLKEVLTKAETKKVKSEADKEAEKKRRETVESKVAKAKQRAKDRIVKDLCWQRVIEHHSEWDLSFLDNDEEADNPIARIKAPLIIEPPSELVVDKLDLYGHCGRPPISFHANPLPYAVSIKSETGLRNLLLRKEIPRDLIPEMKPEELELLKKDMRKRKTLSLATGQRKIKIAFEAVLISSSTRIEPGHCMIIFMNTIKAARSELIEVCEKADIEIGHLKEVLTKEETKKVKSEADKEAEKKRRETVESKVAKAKQRAKDRIVKDLCWQRVIEHHSEWDLSFLDNDEEADNPIARIKAPLIIEPPSELVVDKLDLYGHCGRPPISFHANPLPYAVSIKDSRKHNSKDIKGELITTRDTICHLLKTLNKDRAELINLHIKLAVSGLANEEVEDTMRLQKAKEEIKRLEKLLIMIQHAANLKVEDISAMAFEVGYERSGALVQWLFSKVDLSLHDVSSSH
ncbi:hypothetical protein COCNU_scaffold004324G000010 [Cocos nucifera]|nr:hypothetical protein [Cocos nucifera]